MGQNKKGELIMKRITSLALSAIFTVFFPGFMVLSSTAAEAETIVYEQSPGHFGGFSSDGQFITVADDFQLSQRMLIHSITWWGGYLSSYLPNPADDNFTIRLFSDDGGKPGALIQTFDAGNNASRIATGNFVNPPDPFVGFEGRPEFQYSFTLSTDFPAEGNTRYWLSIVNVPSSDSWVWEVSGSQINLGVQRSFSDPVFGPWAPYFDNTAFQLQTNQDLSRLTVTIDIKPGSFPNSINLGSGGTVPVAILSTPTFDATAVDPASVTLARAPVKLKGKGTPMASIQDVNNDGLLDLVVHVTTEALALSETDTSAALEGLTFGGKAITGTDSVRIVP